MNSNNELYHHGVKGMKWGQRKQASDKSGKLHVGIDDKGNLTLTKEKTTRNNVKKFAIKMSIFTSSIAASIYISKHPEIITKGMKMCSEIFNKNKGKTVEDIITYGGVYSEKLGRFLTDAELAANGL